MDHLREGRLSDPEVLRGENWTRKRLYDKGSQAKPLGWRVGPQIPPRLKPLFIGLASRYFNLALVP
ncbi:hypothetical protein DVG80_21360 [Rhodococcus erythropolis]|nr:hypothetical protein DVG80_21360 [Rhodococcus erythropolis]